MTFELNGRAQPSIMIMINPKEKIGLPWDLYLAPSSPSWTLPVLLLVKAMMDPAMREPGRDPRENFFASLGLIVIMVLSYKGLPS